MSKQRPKRKPREFLVNEKVTGYAEAGGNPIEIEPSRIPDVITLVSAEGRELNIPYRCPKCHIAGMLLLHDMEHNLVDVICASREDANGWAVEGCYLTITSFPMTQAEWKGLRMFADTLWFQADGLGIRGAKSGIEFLLPPRMSVSEKTNLKKLSDNGKGQLN